MAVYNEDLEKIKDAVRPALQSSTTTENERKHFVYDLINEVYQHVSRDLNDWEDDTDERTWFGQVKNAALPTRSIRD